MSNEEQFLITARFPSWGDEGFTFPAFGVKYLINTPIIIPVTDEDGEIIEEDWNYEEEIANYFKQYYKDTIKKDFDGEILFIEPVQYVTLHPLQSK